MLLSNWELLLFLLLQAVPSLMVYSWARSHSWKVTDLFRQLYTSHWTQKLVDPGTGTSVLTTSHTHSHITISNNIIIQIYFQPPFLLISSSDLSLPMNCLILMVLQLRHMVLQLRPTVLLWNHMMLLSNKKLTNMEFLKPPQLHPTLPLTLMEVLPPKPCRPTTLQPIKDFRFVCYASNDRIKFFIQ